MKIYATDSYRNMPRWGKEYKFFHAVFTDVCWFLPHFNWCYFSQQLLTSPYVCTECNLFFFFVLFISYGFSQHLYFEYNLFSKKKETTKESQNTVIIIYEMIIVLWKPDIMKSWLYFKLYFWLIKIVVKQKSASMLAALRCCTWTHCCLSYMLTLVWYTQ